MRSLDEDGRVFSEELRVKAPEGSREAIAIAAARKHTTRSEYVRQAVIRSLEADGVNLGARHRGG
jgi:hypothetical protein